MTIGYLIEAHARARAIEMHRKGKSQQEMTYAAHLKAPLRRRRQAQYTSVSETDDGSDSDELSAYPSPLPPRFNASLTTADLEYGSSTTDYSSINEDQRARYAVNMDESDYGTDDPPLISADKAQQLLDKAEIEDAAFFGDSPFIITSKRKYEVNELVGVFTGRVPKILYEIFVATYIWTALWSYAAVFANSTTQYIPIVGMTEADQCDMNDDSSDIPSECQNAYYIWMVIFSALVVPLTCIELTETTLVQIALCIFRFVAISIMVATTYISMFANPFGSYSMSESPPYIATDRLFHWSGFGQIFSTAVFAQLMHHSVPGLCQPVRTKKNLKKMFIGALSTTFFFYSLLSVITALYFGAGVNQVVTLNWTTYAGLNFNTRNGPVFAKVISYVVVLFPVADIISAYPLNAYTLGNNIFFGLPDRYTDNGRSKIVKIACRLLASVPPIILAIIVNSLATILSFAGTAGFFLAFVFPAMLQILSIRQCQEAFGHWKTPYSGHFSHPYYAWAVLVFGIVSFIVLIVYLSIGLS
eukprot:CAMPEP_0201562904 /NCGR_PEP_ID=MMETSP0173_2-20130828/79590_1 /ASSEMBLY_ACC=CAM_ASM_000268 /TAXON_ID=218659 /ORGANISM="Vexillifera sp., Strain DIVA3 564/2" /LENGTH=528 /DNA_ID=CAMNT_0047977525 /DNA_START=215 /DNA_END=1801 /DNA_ORIENTATION=-